MTRDRRRNLADRAYAALLRFYPADFRARFAADMRLTFSRDYNDAQTRGARSLLGFWFRAFVEASRFGVAERLRPRPRQPAAHDISRRASMWSRMMVDWRDSLRALRATPVVTLMAVLSLALGIGANTALFSILNSLVLKTLPVREPQQLTTLLGGSWTNPIWEQIRDREDRIGAGAFAWMTTRFDLAQSGESDAVNGALASGAMFDVLGVLPARGRLFTTADDVRGGRDGKGIAVVSYGFWQGRLARADDVIGRTISLDRVPFTIVGVMLPDFTGPDVGRSCDVIIPLGNEPLIKEAGGSFLDRRSTWVLEIMLRLKPGQSIEQADAALRGVQPQIREATIPPDFPPQFQATYLTSPFTLAAASTGRSGLRTRIEQPLVIMMVVVGAVLLIACANIANLLLARANARRRDLTIRLALGASRSRIAWQLIWESAFLAVAGCTMGLLVARAGAAFLVGQMSGTYLDTSLDLRVLGFTAGVGFITALVFGTVPALGAARLAPAEALKDQGRTVAGDRRIGFRNALLVVQVALSLMLIVAAGLFVRTFQSLATISLGMNVEPLMIVNVDARRSGSLSPLIDVTADRSEARHLLFERLREAAAATPGAKSAALSRIQQLTGGGWNTSVTLPDGQQGQPGIRAPWMNAVTPGWFQTHGIQIVAGRDFTAADRTGSPLVSIINQAFVRRFFGGENPIGKRVSRGIPGGEQTETEIIGVVSDSAYRTVREGFPATMYVALRQGQADSGVILTVESASGSAGDLQRQLGQALTNVDAGVAFTMQPFAERIRSTIAQERLVAILSGFFGGLALLLACVGLYGVTAYGVSRRRNEIGVRMALGAEPGSVVRLVLGRVAWLVGIGVAIGAGVSYWAAKYIAPAILFGLQPRDTRTFVTAAAVLIAVGMITAWLPARRASRIDPTQVLRES